MSLTTEMPAAWMGYAPREARDTSKPYVRVCSWCPDKAAAHALAAEHGFLVTDGICPDCKINLMKQVTGDRTE
jgi:hypothetical protein